MKIQTTSLETSHFPVMLNEIIKISSPKKRAISAIRRYSVSATRFNLQLIYDKSH